MELAGKPSVTLGFDDQINFFRNVALNNGVPHIRWVTVPRVGTGAERVATFYDSMIKALMDPLTAKEKEEGLYSPPAPPRVLFEGTLDEAQDFYQQTVLVENCRNCPIAKYTDGLPIIIPTEEKVAAMLTGTSHSPTEVIKRYTATDAEGKWLETGAQVTYAQKFTSTVEKAAICAVMAGCKPEYMPIALAIASSGGNVTACPGTSSAYAIAWIVSGPIAKEIGMNAGQQAQDVGNPANMTLGRVGALMTVNFGGCITGIVRTDNGNPLHSICFAEDSDGLPPGWEGLNEESSYTRGGVSTKYTKKDSVIMGLKDGMTNWMLSQLHAPGSYRQMESGYGGSALRIWLYGTQLGQNPLPIGTPGPRNWLLTFLPDLARNCTVPPGGHTYVFHPNMATYLWNYGFKKKADAYKWMADTFWVEVGWWRASGWYEYNTDGGKSKESTSGVVYNDLPFDYKIRACGTGTSNAFIVSNGIGADELCYVWAQGRGSIYAIDAWR